ncbi:MULTISPECIES: hypothetical protein [unclassified Clostridium]|uniref:hypothetical protein n=1 Tax=unclassified Clostridium TaxID=2614128 RepID=UPI0020797F90|nr:MULTISPECIES: hypothetical protein [unclassified Clostridium]
MNKKNKKPILGGIILLIISCIGLIVAPVLTINIEMVKKQILYVFHSKENAYQYLQFVGTFLGVIVTIIGTYILMRIQLSKEKEIEIQTNVRNQAIEVLLDIKTQIYKFKLHIMDITFLCENILEESTLNSENQRNFVKEKFKEVSNNYANQMSDLMKKYEFSIILMKYIEYDINTLNNFDSEISTLTSSISFKLSALPTYNTEMIKVVYSNAKDLDVQFDNKLKEIEKIIDELKKYYN